MVSILLKTLKNSYFTTITTTSRPMYFLFSVYTVLSLRLTNVKARISPTAGAFRVCDILSS